MLLVQSLLPEKTKGNGLEKMGCDSNAVSQACCFWMYSHCPFNSSSTVRSLQNTARLAKLPWISGKGKRKKIELECNCKLPRISKCQSAMWYYFICFTALPLFGSKPPLWCNWPHIRVSPWFSWNLSLFMLLQHYFAVLGSNIIWIYFHSKQLHG